MNNIGLKMVNLTPYANSAELEDFHRKMCDMSVMLVVETEKHIQRGAMDKLKGHFFQNLKNMITKVLRKLLSPTRLSKQARMVINDSHYTHITTGGRSAGVVSRYNQEPPRLNEAL